MTKLTDTMYEALGRVYSETVVHGHPWALAVHWGSADALVRRGLLETPEDRKHWYRLTDAGRAVLAELDAAEAAEEQGDE